MREFAASVEVLVMGGGACGAVAALAAHDAGAEVLLVERDARPLGTTGMSMGLVCAAGTRAQARHGVEDSGDIFLADILAKTRGQTDPAIARAIAFGSGPALDWLVERHDLPWDLDPRFKPSYGNSRLRVHGWLGHTGEDMITLLHRRLADAQVMALHPASVTAILADPAGCITGATITRPDGTVETVGCKALVVASGGFAGNHDMLARHVPDMAAARNNGHEGSQGDGIALAQVLGAAVRDMGAFQGYAMLTEPQGISVPPGFLIEGGILVNASGRRFVDESDDIAGMVHPVLAQPDAKAFVVFDHRIEASNAYQPDAARLTALNAARRGASPGDLAAAIGADPAELTATLAEAQLAFAEGKADRLGRRWTADAPPPAGALAAYRVTGAIYHTQGGLQIDGEARVLRDDGTPFINLFAGGGAARSVSGPSSWGYLPAMGLCTAVTLGRAAGQGAARSAGYPSS
jgi:fumarate reductase flavoprotein subunit